MASPLAVPFAVAGWAATGEHWDAFVSDWQAILSRFAVPYMHMREFAHSRGPFEKGWKEDEPKRRAFIDELNTAISSHKTASFVCFIDRDEFEKANHEFKLGEDFGNESALCGLSCVQQVYKWLREQSMLPSADCVFEDGDERGRLTEIMKSRGYPDPVFGPKMEMQTPVGIIPGVLSLQAADMLAYEARLNYDRYGDAELALEDYKNA